MSRLKLASLLGLVVKGVNDVESFRDIASEVFKRGTEIFAGNLNVVEQ